MSNEEFARHLVETTIAMSRTKDGAMRALQEARRNCILGLKEIEDAIRILQHERD